jgi:hypothetical protein
VSQLQHLEETAALTLQAICLPCDLPLMLHQDFKSLPISPLSFIISFRLSLPLRLSSPARAHYLPALQLGPLDHGLTPDSLIDTLSSLALPC